MFISYGPYSLNFTLENLNMYSEKSTLEKKNYCKPKNLLTYMPKYNFVKITRK